MVRGGKNVAGGEKKKMTKWSSLTRARSVLRNLTVHGRESRGSLRWWKRAREWKHASYNGGQGRYDSSPAGLENLRMPLLFPAPVTRLRQRNKKKSAPRGVTGFMPRSCAALPMFLGLVGRSPARCFLSMIAIPAAEYFFGGGFFDESNLSVRTIRMSEM